MAQGKDMRLLERAIDYEFNNKEYLICALTHSSYANEQRSRGISQESNERLEFLGDAVLDTIISEHLFDTFRQRREGSLTKMRQALVCEENLAKIAAELKIGDYLSIGHGEEITDCRNRPKVLADAFEAIVAAIYLDAKETGRDGYTRVIIDLFEKKITEIQNGKPTDYKTLLQQFAEQDGTAVLRYETIQTGELHDPTFTTTAYINNNAVGTGTSGTKKGSEMAAARVALSLFGIIE